MKNSISVSMAFDFKGKRHSPSMVVDLDRHIKANGNLDSLCRLLASSSNIDPYSYEYEVMLATDLQFSNATGLADAFLSNGKFDFAGFEQALQGENLSQIMSILARKHLSIDDLSAQPNLKAALLEAYQLGKDS